MILNEQQKEAIRYISGPCLVIAGAGSGKTRVITEKIVFLINKCGFLPNNICAVTFTNKAAKEMKERLSSYLSASQMKGLRIGTFHSLCLDILRVEYKALNLRKNFSLFDEYDQLGIMKEVIEGSQYKNICLENLTEFSKICLSQISSYKNNLLYPNEIIIEKPEDKIIAEIYKSYSELMLSYNAVDFDDLIFLIAKLFLENEGIANKWANSIKHLLVDEYQDTNTCQYKLLKLLVKNRESFTFVGDDDQAIYSWRGANPKNMQSIGIDYPRLRVIKLEQNYRSKGVILNCANKLISNNIHLYNKQLFSNLDYGKKIVVIEAKNAHDEAQKVVADLLAHHYKYGTKYSEYAFLYRSNYQSQEIQQMLQESSIPFRLIATESFFEQAEIKDFMSYLRIIANQDDSKAFLRVINIPRREIGSATINKLESFANERNISLFNAAHSRDIESILREKQCNVLNTFTNYILDISESLKQSNPLWKNNLNNLINSTEYNQWLENEFDNEKVRNFKIKNILTLIEWIQKLMDGKKDQGIEGISFEEAISKLCLREMLDKNEQDFELDEVQLLTLHSSKGLEFNYVYMIGVEEGILPHKNSIEQEEGVEEERRLAYVGITRAKKELVMSYCINRNSKDKRNAKVEPSRFLNELPQEDLSWIKFDSKKDEVQEAQKRDDIFAAITALLNSK